MSGLRERLADGRAHVLDGAMGTLLYERGVFLNVCYDELNLSRPRLVEDIHREYIDVGARILETNTFGANPVKLSSFGLDERTEEINRVAVERARVAVRSSGARDVLVLGAFGPLGIRIEPWGPTSEDEAEAFFARQVAGLVEGGVDGFLLETFQDLGELRQALRAVRSRSDLPVIAQVTIEEGGRTAYGTEVEQVAATLSEWKADAVGLNCSVGPSEMLEAVERMRGATDLPISAQPNAGLPRSVGDRKIYLARPDYMARYAVRMIEAGARFVGGCCGTTPAHIRQIALAVREHTGLGAAASAPAGSGAGEHSTDRAGPRAADRVAPRPEPSADRVAPRPEPSAGGAAPRPEPSAGRSAPLRDRSPLGRMLAQGEFVASLELLPPRGWDPAALLQAARSAQRAGADLVSVPDAPRGQARMASLPAADLIRREVGIEVIAHYACRDRNMLGMISDLMGAAATGIRNLLIVSGDPLRTGPYPDQTAVFDIDSIGLTNVVHRLNDGLDPGGHEVEPPTRFVIGVALNQGAADLEYERGRFRWKVDAGAEFAVTQPVFDASALERFMDAERGGDIPILAGVWPLDSARTAEFLDNEVPGVVVPLHVVERMREAETEGPEAARREGVKIAIETAKQVLPRVAGIHVSSARIGLDLALEVLREVRALGRTADQARNQEENVHPVHEEASR